MLTIFSVSTFAQTDVYLNINHFLGSSAFALNQVASNDLGEEFKVSRLEYYVSQITLVHDGGIETVVPNTWILVNATQNVSQLLGNFSITNLEAVKFGLGVENAVNHLDPSTYSILHPLGPKSPSMHWGWSAGYRFLALEGKTGSSFNLTYEIHALGDVNYAIVNLPTTGEPSGSDLNINIDADYEMILKGISVASGPISHGETGISATSLVNCNKYVFSIAPAAPNGIADFGKQIEMDVYPNPSKGIVNVRYDQTISGNVEITVLDVRGQLVAKKSVSNSDDAFISISTNGLYMVNLIVDGEVMASKRVVISN